MSKKFIIMKLVVKIKLAHHVITLAWISLTGSPIPYVQYTKQWKDHLKDQSDFNHVNCFVQFD